MLNFINIGTFFIEFQFSIVGSTDTAASPLKNCQGQSQFSCRAVGGRVEPEEGW
jgi:hypothetical protein